MSGRLRLTSLVALLLAVAASAQVRYRPDETGPWRPWTMTAIASARQARGATSAEVQAFEARLKQLAAIVRRAPAVATPIGFAGELWGSLDGYGISVPGQPAGTTVPLAGGVSFGAFPLIEFTRNGRLMNEDLKGGETALLQFRVNAIERGVFSASAPIEWIGDDDPGFFEPLAGAPVQGLPRFGDVLVLTNRAAPLWVPLSLEASLRPVIDGRRDALAHRREIYAKQVAEFTEWKTPAKRAARRADWATAAKSMPDGAAFLANVERSDVEIEKARTADLGPGGGEERGVQEAERDLAEAEAALSALTPDERAGPACYASRAEGLARKFRPLTGPSSPACQAIVRTNWAFFDRAVPRSAPQVLVIDSYMRCLESGAPRQTSPGGCVTNRRLMESIDWDAVRAWLSPP